MLTKSLSCNEIRKRFNSNSSAADSAGSSRKSNSHNTTAEAHKTVIYFGDSIASRKHNASHDQLRAKQSPPPISRNLSNKSEDFQHARRLCEEMVLKRQYSIRHPKSKISPFANKKDEKCALTKEPPVSKSKSNLSTFKSDQSLVMKELKSVVEVKLKNQIPHPPKPPPPPFISEKPVVPQKKIVLTSNRSVNSIECAVVQSDKQNVIKQKGDDKFLPSFVESVVNGVINIKIDGSFVAASKLAESFGRDGNDNVSEFADNGSDIFLDVGGEVNNIYFDWSFVQDWRAGANENNAINGNRLTIDRINNTNNLGKSEVFSYQITNDIKSANNNVVNQSKSKINNIKNCRNVEQQVGSDMMKPDHHASIHRLRETQYYRKMCDVQECHSSSEENRSSGHASMSENGHGSTSPGHTDRSSGQSNSLLRGFPATVDDNKILRLTTNTLNSRTRHRITPTKPPWKGSEIKDIKLAIRQLTMGSQTSTTSSYSSLSIDLDNTENTRRLNRDFSSVETINTNVTAADEFVWVDSRNRLVELQHPPWNQHCIMRVLRMGRCREISDRISLETIPRLGYLLQRALVRIAREVQRLSTDIGLCSKHEIAGAFKIILCPTLSDTCIKACLRAATMFGVPGDYVRLSKAARAGLQMPVGRFHRWMCDARLGRFVHEYAAVYLCAGMENLLEEIVVQCMPSDESMQLTAIGLEHAIAVNGDFWGLLQPYAHLNAGRIASGALTMPRWPNQSLGGSISSLSSTSNIEPCLLTTCVGSILELNELVGRAQGKCCHNYISHAALNTLFYFMRCSQLERNESHDSCFDDDDSSVQELCYERAYVVLPSLIEWLRVASANTDYRQSMIIDKDDIMQAARLLLPGVDCPPRTLLMDEEIPMRSRIIFSSPSPSVIRPNDDVEIGRRATLTLSFKFMLSGKIELMQQAVSILPPTTRYDTLNEAGLTALMIAAIRNDEVSLQMLLDAGARVNIEVPAIGTPGCSAIHSETQHWTALTFAACRGNHQIVKTLLARGARIEGGVRLGHEDNCTLTPLQLASSSATSSLITLLLNHRANPFLSTKCNDSLNFTGTAQRGSYSAISVAVVHDNSQVLQKLLNHPLAPASRDVLSLEEMLAEDISSMRTTDRANDVTPKLTKTQIKCLQEAMYHSAENNHLHITVELRGLGVPWSLHCWMHALAAAHELQLNDIVDQLLHDFLEICPDDYNSQFIFECLPLLFNIFRYSKKDGTQLLLVDIFATCFGWETIKPIREPVLQPVNGSRIDLKFVNNPELSDVMFRVEGKIFYAHKIVLVTASPRFQSLLSSKLSEGGTPTVQINDIRYRIFQLVMQFLYSGGCNSIDVTTTGDLLELMAAASFFQLQALLRYTESRCSQLIDSDNIVTMYIHAKVYNAPKLLEFCQGFILQNIVTLLNYDDAMKRLLFAKKIPNHDVLQGLLMILQARIEYRYTAPNSTKLRQSITQIK